MDEDDKISRLGAAGYTSDTEGPMPGILAPDGRKFPSIAEAYNDLLAAEEILWKRQERTPDAAFYVSDAVPDADLEAWRSGEPLP